MESVVLLPMSMEHLDAVYEIEQTCYSTPWSRRAFENEISNRSAFYTVALVNNRVVGYAGEWLVIDEAHITNIAVHPIWRRRGIGERLLIELLMEAADRKMERATLEVRVSNIPAQKLYLKYYFNSVGVRKKYYPDTNEDADIMWAEGINNETYVNYLKERKEILSAANILTPNE